VDYLKLDGCYANPKSFDTGYPSVTKALNNTGRLIVFSCSWPAYQVGQGVQVREFSKQLKSLPTRKHIPKRADNFEDFTFWAIKLYAEDMIRATGFIVYDSLESWALSQFVDKERSTIRAKCRSIWNWYNERDFKLNDKKHREQKKYLEETMATRTEHIKKVSREKAERNRRKVINLITGLYADDYKKKNGAWHFGKISEATGISSKTVGKIIKELEKD